MLDMLEFLRDEGVSADITAEIEKFRDAYPEEDETLRRRVPDPRYLYYGKDIWEEAITAILCGENLLLSAQGHWQECAGGKPGHRVRPPQLERVLLHQHRRRHPAGHGHL